MLVELERADFIYEQPGPADRQYSFKHALTQEVAYGEMLLERRRDYIPEPPRPLKPFMASGSISIMPN